MDVLTNSKSDKIRLSKNCHELMIWNFNELLKGSGFEWLVYGYSGESQNYNLDYKECEKVLKDIKNEYYELSKNEEAINILLLESEIFYLNNRFNNVGVLLMVLLSGKYSASSESGYLEELKEWRYYVDHKKPLLNELKKLSKQHQSSKTAINRKIAELEKIVEDASVEKITLIRQKIKLTRILNMQLDLKNMSVAEWLEVIAEATEVIKTSSNGERNKGNQ